MPHKNSPSRPLRSALSKRLNPPSCQEQVCSMETTFTVKEQYRSFAVTKPSYAARLGETRTRHPKYNALLLLTRCPPQGRVAWQVVAA